MDDRQRKSIIGRDADAAPAEPVNDTRNATSPPPAGERDDLDDFDEDDGFDILFELEPHPYGSH